MRDYLTLPKAAALAGITRQAMARRARNGRLKTVTIGDVVFTTREWIIASEEPLKNKMGRPPKRVTMDAALSMSGSLDIVHRMAATGEPIPHDELGPIADSEAPPAQ